MPKIFIFIMGKREVTAKKISCPVRLRQAPSLKADEKARLRVNPEQALAFRPGSRRVDFSMKNIINEENNKIRGGHNHG
jgi:hypothetical protein